MLKYFLYFYTLPLLLSLTAKRLLTLFVAVFLSYISLYLLTFFLLNMIPTVLADENTSSLITTKSNNDKSQEEVQSFYTKISNFWSGYKWYIIAGVTIGIGLLVFNLKGPNGDDSLSSTPGFIQEVSNNNLKQDLKRLTMEKIRILYPYLDESQYRTLERIRYLLLHPETLWRLNIDPMTRFLENFIPNWPIEAKANFLSTVIYNLVGNTAQEKDAYLIDIFKILKSTKITYPSNEWNELVIRIADIIDIKYNNKGLSKEIFNTLINEEL